MNEKPKQQTRSRTRKTKNPKEDKEKTTLRQSMHMGESKNEEKTMNPLAVKAQHEKMKIARGEGAAPLIFVGFTHAFVFLCGLMIGVSL